MESRDIRISFVLVVIFALFIVFVGCSDDPTKPDSDEEKPPEGFVAISVDTFTMGSPTGEIDRGSDETLHKVTLTTPFYMSATEVTNQQYAEMAQWAYDNGYCTANSDWVYDNLDGSTEKLFYLEGNSEISFSGSTFIVVSGKEEQPVFDVTWFGAAAYCDWLSLRQRITRAYDHRTWQCNDNAPYNASGYRLPTEAEWEYACRAGTQNPFNTGTCLDAGTEANYNGNYPYSGCPTGPNVGGRVPVGSYPANIFDLYDMHGNVGEWCNDWYSAYSGDETNPVGSTVGTSRVTRGGGWGFSAQVCRSANRGYGAPDSAYWVGFRLVRSVN